MVVIELILGQPRVVDKQGVDQRPPFRAFPALRCDNPKERRSSLIRRRSATVDSWRPPRRLSLRLEHVGAERRVFEAELPLQVEFVAACGSAPSLKVWSGVWWCASSRAGVVPSRKLA